MEIPYTPEAQSSARQGMEGLLKVAKPPASHMEELRSLSGYDGRKLAAKYGKNWQEHLQHSEPYAGK